MPTSWHVNASGQMPGGGDSGEVKLTLLNVAGVVARATAVVAARPARYGPEPMSIATEEPSTGVHETPSGDVIVPKNVTGGLKRASW